MAYSVRFSQISVMDPDTEIIVHMCHIQMSQILFEITGFLGSVVAGSAGSTTSGNNSRYFSIRRGRQSHFFRNLALIIQPFPFLLPLHNLRCPIIVPNFEGCGSSRDIFPGGETSAENGVQRRIKFYQK